MRLLVLPAQLQLALPAALQAGREGKAVKVVKAVTVAKVVRAAMVARAAEVLVAKAGTPQAAVVKVAPEAVVDAVKAVQAVVPEVLADHGAASVNISAKRKSASSASRRWISSTTSVPTFFLSLCRSAAKFCLAA